MEISCKLALHLRYRLFYQLPDAVLGQINLRRTHPESPARLRGAMALRDVVLIDLELL